LYQNGILTPADGDWYLRSSVRDIVGPTVMLPKMASAAGLAVLGSMHDRGGEAAHVNGNDDNRGGAWVRFIGTANTDTFTTTVGDFGSSNSGMFGQVGVDLFRNNNTHWGVYAATGDSEVISRDDLNAKTGGIEMDSTSVGAYVSHYGDSFYFDAVLQYSRIDAEVFGDTDSYSTEADGWLASFEGGWEFFKAGKSSFELQGQFIYGRTDTDNASDGFVDYQFETDTTSQARVGLRWSGDQGPIVPYLKLNYWHSFSDNPTVTAGPVAINSALGDNWVSIGAGFSVLTKNNWSIFMSYDHEKGLSDSDRANNSGTVGIRKNW